MANKLRVSKQCIEVLCDRNDYETQLLVAKFYPVTSNRIKTHFFLSPRLLPEILKIFRGVDASNIEDAPRQIRELYFEEMRTREATAELMVNGPRRPGIVNEHLTLEPHQQLARELAEYHDKFAFFYDTRTGKTPLSIAIMQDDIRRNPSHKWVVVCPLMLVYNAWMEDTEKFIPDTTVINCHDTLKTRRLAAFNKPGNIYIVNTEAFVSYREQVEALQPIGCIVDESSDMKSPKSNVSKALVDFAFNLKRFYLLSGTPAPNGEWEYYMQMRAVDYYGWHQSYSQFKEHYFVNLSYNPQYEKLAVKPDKKEQLMDTVKAKAMFLDKEDVLDTPGRAFYEVPLAMPVELAKQYRQMKNELYAQVGEDLRIIAKGTGAKLNKLNQISSGFVMDTIAAKENKFYDTDLAEWHLLSSYRFEALQELLTSDKFVGEQVIIWANYRREFELIVETLGAEKCRCVYGGVNITEKNEAIKLFKERKVQYLIANPASADKGLTLTNCHLNIYFSLNWSYELFKQSMERIYGSKKIQPLFCEYYVLLAEGTIDEVLYHEVLQGKRDSSYAVLKHLRPEVAFK